MQGAKLGFLAIALGLVLVAIVGCSSTRSRTAATPDAKATRAPAAKSSAVDKPADKPGSVVPKVSPAETAINTAAKQNRYVFVTFYRDGDDASKNMRAAMAKAQVKLSRRASFVSADVDDPVHQEVVSRYGADRSPIPLTIVIAPNGAITAGYPNTIENADFPDAFVSNGMAGVIKALQDQKLAVVCVQNARTKHSKESMAAARALASAEGFAGATEIVRINPADPGEVKTLQRLQASPSPSEAQIIVLAPPGKVAGKFSGAVSTETMIASVSKACGPGGSCGPSG